MNFHRIRGHVYAARALGWQLDYRPTGYLPFSIRYGLRKNPWHVLSLGRFGCITLGRLVQVKP